MPVILKKPKWKEICAAFTTVNAHDSAHSKAYGIELGASGPDLAESVAASMPSHFISDVDHYLRKYDHKRFARFLKTQLPSNKQAKSGDFGEVVATEILRIQKPDFDIPLNRLCWKDSPLPMRGDDVIGFDFVSKPVRVLKAECKSGKNIAASTVANARAALEKNKGLPSSHSLNFIIQRLHEADRDGEADKIDSLDGSLTRRQVTHCIFTVSQNDGAVNAIRDDAASVKAPHSHFAYALRIEDHPGAVKKSYQLAVKHV